MEFNYILIRFGNASENGQSFSSKTVGSLTEDRYRLGHWWVFLIFLILFYYFYFI